MSDEIKKSEETKVSWNLSQSLIVQIANLLQQASAHFVNGNIQSAFVRLQNLRLLIHHDLTPEESKLLSDLEEKYQGSMLNFGIEMYKGFQIDQQKKAAFSLGRRKYIEYHNQLMASLKKHGYTISQKEDSSRMF